MSKGEEISKGQIELILEMFGLINQSVSDMKVEVSNLRTDMREDISDLHKKVDAVVVQTTRTNGRVTDIEKVHESCPGSRAIEKVAILEANAQTDKAVKEATDIITSSKSYIIGTTVKNWSITLAAVTTIIVGIVLISKHFII